MYLRKHHVSLASQKSKARKDLRYPYSFIEKKIRDGSNGLFKLVGDMRSPDLQWPFQPCPDHICGTFSFVVVMLPSRQFCVV